MIRLAVALYLMVVTAAGPWLCCCTFTRLASRAVPEPSSHKSPPPPQPCSCCQHPHQQESPDPAEQTPHRPLSPDCPCKQGATCEAQALPQAPRESLDNPLRASGWTDWQSVFQQPSVFALPAPWPVPVGDRSVVPFLSADDLLHLLHILRC